MAEHLSPQNARRPKDAWALVTGASSPIGRAIATTLAQEGWNIIAGYGSNEAAAEQTCAAVAAHQRACTSLQLDLGQPQQYEDALRQLMRTHKQQDLGPIVGLVTNAAANFNALVARTKSEDLAHMFDVNLASVYNCSRILLRPMMQHSYGKIVYIGSTAGNSGNAGQAAYAMSKSALTGLAKSLAREYGSKNITCNVVAPGWVETPMSAETLEKHGSDIVDQIPLGRLGSAEDVAHSVAFLMSEKAGYITGQSLMVNGGIYM